MLGHTAIPLSQINFFSFFSRSQVYRSNFLKFFFVWIEAGNENEGMLLFNSLKVWRFIFKVTHRNKRIVGKKAQTTKRPYSWKASLPSLVGLWLFPGMVSCTWKPESFSWLTPIPQPLKGGWGKVIIKRLEEGKLWKWLGWRWHIL